MKSCSWLLVLTPLVLAASPGRGSRSPVLVAEVDLPVGTVITAAHLSARELDDALITPSMLQPESMKSAVGQKTVLPLLAGDVLQWACFDPAVAKKHCDFKTAGTAKDQVNSARARVLRR